MTKVSHGARTSTELLQAAHDALTGGDTTISPTSTPDQLRSMFALTPGLINAHLFDQAMEILYAMYEHPNVADSWKPKVAMNIAAALRDGGHHDLARSWYLEATMRADDERDADVNAILQKINVALTLD